MCVPLSLDKTLCLSPQEARHLEGPSARRSAALPRLWQRCEDRHQQDRGVPGGQPLPPEVILPPIILLNHFHSSHLKMIIP